MTQHNWHDIPIEITRKKIKNLHLRVQRATGRVTVSAPHSMALDAIRAFVTSKRDWIKKHRTQGSEQAPPAPCYVDDSAHFYLGRRYVLKTIPHRSAGVAVNGEYLEVRVRGPAHPEKVRRILAIWYREKLGDLADALVSQWETVLKVRVRELCIRAMKTKWGTCKPSAARIWLNLELVKRKKELIEFVVVHELVHLVERKHNQRFKQIMTDLLPDWKMLRKELNQMSPEA